MKEKNTRDNKERSAAASSVAVVAAERSTRGVCVGSIRAVAAR